MNKFAKIQSLFLILILINLLFSINIFTMKSEKVDQFFIKHVETLNRSISNQSLDGIIASLKYIVDYDKLSDKTRTELKFYLKLFSSKKTSNYIKESLLNDLKNLSKKLLNPIITKINDLNLSGKRVSSPIVREHRKIPGTLQELLIASGYFFFDEKIMEIAKLPKLNQTLREITNIIPKTKKDVKEWKKSTDYKQIQKITGEIESIKTTIQAIDKQIELYEKTSATPITDISVIDLERQVFGSNESIRNLFMSSKMATQNEEDIKDLYKIIKYQQEAWYKSIAQDFLGRNWNKITIPDLKRDTERLSQLLNINFNEIWPNFISKRLLFKIFDIIESDQGRKKAIKKLETLLKTFYPKKKD